MRILVDCDEVLAQFMKPAIALAEKFAGKKYPIENFISSSLEENIEDEIMTLLKQEFKQPGYIESLMPYEEALVGIEKLKSIGDVYCITAPIDYVPTWAYERLNWLKKHFDLPKAKVGIFKSKNLVRGDVFVDDLPSNITKWATDNIFGTACLLVNEFNKKEKWEKGVPVNSWQDIINISNNVKNLL